MPRSDRPHLDPGRQPIIIADSQSVDKDDGQIVNSAGLGRMVESVSVQESAQEEAPSMPTPTRSLSTSTPS